MGRKKKGATYKSFQELISAQNTASFSEHSFDSSRASGGDDGEKENKVITEFLDNKEEKIVEVDNKDRREIKDEGGEAEILPKADDTQKNTNILHQEAFVDTNTAENDFRERVEVESFSGGTKKEFSPEEIKELIDQDKKLRSAFFQTRTLLQNKDLEDTERKKLKRQLIELNYKIKELASQLDSCSGGLYSWLMMMGVDQSVLSNQEWLEDALAQGRAELEALEELLRQDKEDKVIDAQLIAYLEERLKQKRNSFKKLEKRLGEKDQKRVQRKRKSEIKMPELAKDNNSVVGQSDIKQQSGEEKFKEELGVQINNEENKDSSKTETVFLAEDNVALGQPEVDSSVAAPEEEVIQLSEEDIVLGAPLETEKNLAELRSLLAERRNVFIGADLKLQNIRKSENKEGLIDAELEYERAKFLYEKTRLDYFRKAYQSKIDLLHQYGLEKDSFLFDKHLHEFLVSTFMEIIENESDLLAQAKLQNMEPRKRTWFRKLMANYASLPNWKKLLYSTGIVTGLLVGGASLGLGGGFVVAAAAPGAYAVQRIIRGLIGGKLGSLTFGLIKSLGARSIEKWRSAELENLRRNFAVEIQSQTINLMENEQGEVFDLFSSILDTYIERNESLIRETNRRHRNITFLATGGALLAGGAAAWLSGPFADQILHSLDYGIYEAHGAAITHIVDQGTLPKFDAGFDNVSESSVAPELTPRMHEQLIDSQTLGIKDIDQSMSSGDIIAPSESMMPNLEEAMLPIGKRGPEGAIIDYFRNHPDVAVEKFGFPKELCSADGKITNLEVFNRWAGVRAHQLWLADAKEALKRPDVLENLKKLGYSQDLDGYEKMMRHISEGNIKINIEKGEIDLVDVQYLKPSISSAAEEVSSQKLRVDTFSSNESNQDFSGKLINDLDNMPEDDLSYASKVRGASETIFDSEKVDVSAIKLLLEEKFGIDQRTMPWLNEEFLTKYTVKDLIEDHFSYQESMRFSGRENLQKLVRNFLKQTESFQEIDPSVKALIPKMTLAEFFSALTEVYNGK
jgi:hypothetical protein